MRQEHDNIDLKINDRHFTGMKIADNWVSRLRGLLMTKEEDLTGLLLTDCSSVHTIGMKYPIDIVFINQSRCVSKTSERVAPMRFCFGTADTKSTLELPAGSIEKFGIQIGDQIHHIKHPSSSSEA